MLPRVILHNAISADGRIDWFPADIGLFYKLTSSWSEDATLAGSETILTSDLAEDGNDPAPESKPMDGDTRPILVVPDSRGRVRCWRGLRASGYWKGFVSIGTSNTPKAHLKYLEAAGVEFLQAGDRRVDLRSALEQLRRRFKVKTVRVDSGGTLNGVLLRLGVVSEVSLLVHPSMVGGMSPASMFRAPDLESADGVLKLRLKDVQKLKGGVTWLVFSVAGKGRTG
jgi:2,5-diamino-6-(ribosylamino)-4(3H)-pyrimidinone 5'-phosphate reductase